MNRLLLFLVLISLISLSSCTQEYICQCEVSYSGSQPGLPEPVVKEYFIKDSHDEATKKCESSSTEVTAENITMKQSCRLF